MRRPRRPQLGINWSIVLPVVCAALAAVALGMLCCALVALVGDGRAVSAFGLPGAALLVLAALGLRQAARLQSQPIRPRDGYFAVVLAWLCAAAAGALPLILAESFASPLHAFFESMSGFTTTGATLLAEIEPHPDAVLLWRSITQWVGGVGIVVLVVAIAPATGLASSRIFFAETSGISADRLTPRIADTAKIIVSIYVGLTIAGAVAYLIAGMGVFDAANHTLTTIATGGFSTRTASIAAFDSVAIEVVAIVFMILGGVNFAFYWRALRGRSLWPQAAEVRLFALVLLAGTAALTASLALAGDPGEFGDQLRGGAFTAVSIVTSTGYVTADFDGWNDFARAAVLMLMVIGGCAGSTTGGIKVIRVQLLAKSAWQELERQLRPKAVQVLRTRGRNFSEEVRRGVLGFMSVWLAATVIATFAMLATGLDLLTAFSSVVSTLNIVGPGLGEIGATDNFAAISDPGLAILCFLMLAGRLEIFAVLVLLTPAFWRPNMA